MSMWGVEVYMLLGFVGFAQFYLSYRYIYSMNQGRALLRLPLCSWIVKLRVTTIKNTIIYKKNTLFILFKSVAHQLLISVEQ